MKNETIKNIAYWTTTILGPASFVIGGVLNLTQTEQVVSVMTHLGYPAYFASILGIWKLLGAIAITMPRFPRLKEWAYAGFFFLTTGAIFSHIASGHSASEVFPASLLLVLTVVSWYFRPESRKIIS